jgi:hypothetical protein
VTSFVIDPRWKVQATEMWPELEAPYDAPALELVRKSEARLDGIMSELPDEPQYPTSVARLRDWIAKGLPKESEKFKDLCVFPPKLWNAFSAIQRRQWSDSIPPSRADAMKFKEVLMNMRYPPVTQDLFLKWVDQMMISSSLRRPRFLGEKTRLKDKPSILFPTRLYRTLKQKVKTDSSKSKSTGFKP